MTLLDKLLLRNIEYKGTFYSKFPQLTNIYAIGTIACISGLMFGFDISSMSSMIGTKKYKEYFNHPNATAQGGITGAMAAGSFLGSLLSPNFSDTFGRKLSLHICSILWIVGSIIQSAAQDEAMLIVGRVIAGMGVGFGSSVAPVYCSEISPPKIRGLISGLFQFSITVGIMLLFYIGYACHFIKGTASFRLTWGLQMIPGFVLIVGTLFLPESPRWLANHDRWEETIQIVANVVSKGDVEDEQVKFQLEEIKEQVIIDAQAKNFGFKDLWRPKTRRKIIVGICAQMWQQLCGMNVMMYYIVYIFNMAGYTGNSNLVASSIQYVLFVLVTFPALFLIDKIGRRPVLVAGGVFMFSWLFAVAGLLATYSEPAPQGVDGDTTVTIRIPEKHKSAAKGVIACSYLFVCSFAPTWGIGIWIYCSEIFNNMERAKGSAVTTATNWAFNFALAMFVPSAFKNISWKTYIIFGVFSVALTVQCFFMFPETRGKTLEEIDQMWVDNIPAWKTGSYIPQLPIIEDEEGNKLGLLGNVEYVERVNSKEEGLILQSSVTDSNSQSN
ncbi:high-affinity glucose transporter [Kluyveromyces marxianus DMKU3-1042]|uniref:High-affinity glucose transporter n=1 Tax=Kluyveromyces marxianus (strain DMKU3-1042 / BCC 29191 / NBRC 104275) TaxID=1003335 RepID=W0TCZ7_KLUMD|nr:high-affinity glucose transporter [Kluyveromyces marxianus DMKU3-1042]UZQ22203.1 putative sugar transporter SUT11 [Kluyveromyces marxianus]BAO40686.1 high-affinity glucose transporter [Kluyveromyces marxianus DMKU3-1042]